MDKSGYAMDTMGPYEGYGGPLDGIPKAERRGDQDEIDLAAFGKRSQLKVERPQLVLVIL